MSIEKMRAEFEAWIAERISNNGVSHWLKRKPSEDLIDNGGPYQMIWVEAAWQGWQASRAALVIELPDDGLEDCFREWRDSCRDDFDTGYCYATDRIVAAIESAGVRVKP